MDTYQALMHLVETEDYEKAEKFCLSHVQRGQNVKFWRTQLGYIYFLNERDLESFFNKAPATFKALAEEYPHDANSRFWHGYVSNIVFGRADTARSEFENTLMIDPLHPYANLSLASLVDEERSISLRQATLQTQPFNFRALYYLAHTLLSIGESYEARDILAVMLENEPYSEQDYGIMNEYINDVITGAIKKEYWIKKLHSELET